MRKLKARAYINSIDLLEVPFFVPQTEAISWLVDAVSREGDPNKDRSRDLAKGLYKRIGNQSGLRSRRTFLADYTHTDWDSMSLYRQEETGEGRTIPWYAPSLERRMKVYAEASFNALQNLFRDSDGAPDNLIEISCTGYDAPYASQKLLLRRGWQAQTQLLKLGHMGCYASIPALNLAATLSESGRSVSCVSFEFCTLHLKPQASDPEQIVANSIFADGGARFDIRRDASEKSLAFLGHSEALIPGSLDMMSWSLDSSSFVMTLSRDIPQVLADHVEDYVRSFLRTFQLALDDMKCVAIHPGGPRIISTVQKALNRDDETVRHSKDVLSLYGNMSSATLPHIWNAILQDERVGDGAYILSLAFGPGLSIAMNLMRKSC